MTPLPDDARALFEDPTYAHIAGVLPDGGPHSVPVSIGLHGEQAAFFTQTRSRKARNLARDPRVAISIADFEQPYRMRSGVGLPDRARQGPVDGAAVLSTPRPPETRGRCVDQRTLEGIRDGSIDLAFRRWRRPRVKAGSALRTAVGVLRVDAVDTVAAREVTAAEARRAGFATRAALLARLAGRDGAIHRVVLHHEGEDPRVALRDRVEPRSRALRRAGPDRRREPPRPVDARGACS